MDKPLLLPHHSTVTSPSTSTIITRLTTFLLLTILSLYANYQSSKHPNITILNTPLTSFPARHFDLLFISNGRAASIILLSSNHIQHKLYPNKLYPKKPIHHITLQLSTHNLSEPVSITPGTKPGNYVMHLCPSLLFRSDAVAAVESAVRREVARLLIWDGEGTTPRDVMEAVIEYLLSDSDIVEGSVRFLRCCEERSSGFVARLNREMRERWREDAVEKALGEPVVGRLCAVNGSGFELSQVM